MLQYGYDRGSFSDIHRQCLPLYYSRWPSVTKFKKIMTGSQSIVVKRLAKFFFLAIWTKEKAYLTKVTCISCTMTMCCITQKLCYLAYFIV